MQSSKAFSPIKACQQIREEDEAESGKEIKLAINNLVWTYAGPETTLREAEEMACRFFNDIWQSRGNGSID
jgi:hypothetical protein